VNVRQLEYFVKLAELRSFTRAAQALGISQPTLSQQLKSLEDWCGALLVRRDSHTVSLTGAGELFLTRAVRIISEIKAAQADLDQFSRSAPTLTVGTSGGFPIPRFLGDFAKEHPRVELVVRQQPYAETMKLVAERRFDVGLTRLLPSVSPIPSDVSVSCLAPVRIGILLRSDNLLSRKGVISVADLKSWRLIVPPLESAPRLAVELAMRKEGIVPDKPPFTTSNLTTMIEFVSMGLGVGIVPENRMGYGDRKLRFRELRHADISCQIALAWSKGAKRTPEMEDFIQAAHAWQWHPVAASSQS
jgi:DNA-binding transcriptional LysR family regulator